ncbi:MAG: hypothetical protein CFE27_14710 [Alphaproteobacteria bacterium PA1]|nr:MAG: hypothetical protein CFE27_14710 [Alphaproteobacteria bacterium PA1]
MNDLSVALYWADALGSLDGLALIGFTLMFFMCLFVSFATMAADMDDEQKLEATKALRGFLLSLPVLAVMIVVTPSRETVYAIAASEMTEQALKTPVASKAMQAVEKWIDRQLAGATPQ